MSDEANRRRQLAKQIVFGRAYGRKAVPAPLGDSLAESLAGLVHVHRFFQSAHARFVEEPPYLKSYKRFSRFKPGDPIPGFPGVMFGGMIHDSVWFDCEGTMSPELAKRVMDSLLGDDPQPIVVEANRDEAGHQSSE